MPVNATHPEYDKIVPKWNMVTKIINNDAEDLLLPPDDDPKRTKDYKKNAVLTNFTRLTQDGLCGLVFRKPYKAEFNAALNYIEQDLDGTGLNLNQVSKWCVNETLQTGRMGLLVDFPPAPANLSIADTEQMQLKARVKPYNAESIINWDTITIGSKTLVSFVVLKEAVQKRGDGDYFSWTKEHQYRVLILEADDAGLYYKQQLYNNDLDLVDEYIPTDSNGNAFEYIPFYFAGSRDNNWFIDPIPLYDLARVNLQHYRNNADYQESVYMVGNPTAILGGEIDIESFKHYYGDTLKMNSRAAYFIPGATAQYLQANPNTLAAESMDRLREEAKQIGAKLIEPAGQGRETAEAAKIRFFSQNSALKIIVDNVSICMENALKDLARFMGVSPNSIEFRLNDDFYEETADPNLIISMIQGYDRGIVSSVEIRDYYKKTGTIDPLKGDSIADVEIQLDNNLGELDDDIEE